MSTATTTKLMPKMQQTMPRMWTRKGKVVIQEKIVLQVQILQENLQKAEAIVNRQPREFPGKIQRKKHPPNRMVGIYSAMELILHQRVSLLHTICNLFINS